MSQRRSIIKHPHEYAGAPQILSPAEGFGERFDPSFLKGVGSTISSGGPGAVDYAASSSTTGAGTSGSSSSSSGPGAPSSSSRANQFDLVPQRSAPLPPDSSNASSSSAMYVRSGGAANSSMVSSSTFRPSQESSNGGRLPSNGLSPTMRSGFPVASSGLPSGYAVSSAGPPRPIRSHTMDIGSESGASGFLPASSRSHASVGGPAQSPLLSSPHQSPRVPAAWDTTGLSNSIEDLGHPSNSQSAPTTPAASSQSQFLKGNAARGVGSGPDAGRNTFKAVFGGFVNSMSGKSLPGYIGEEKIFFDAITSSCRCLFSAKED